mmetsp:Transcript_59563/g.145981  ORF Transcript_59563/g.145981 Transcript_59563/m.145981 type:complete len:100 (-) Transcript_59563:71-370(-)
MAAANVIPNVMPDQTVHPRKAFLWMLEFRCGLDTEAKRNRITMTAGVSTVEDLLYIEEEMLLDSLHHKCYLVYRDNQSTMKCRKENQLGWYGSVQEWYH